MNTLTKWRRAHRTHSHPNHTMPQVMETEEGKSKASTVEEEMGERQGPSLWTLQTAIDHRPWVTMEGGSTQIKSLDPQLSYSSSR
jgi:hypothetical protein